MLKPSLVALLLALPGAVFAAPAQYALDPVHTRVLFAIEHAGFSKALGTVSGSTGTLVFDPDDWRSARLQARVPLQRLDLGDEKWNRAALAHNLLDGEHYPEAQFVSTRVEPIDAQHAKVIGQLTLHGVTREVTLDVTLNAVKRHPLPPFRRTAGFSATATLQRADFGISAWPSVIGGTVELRIEAEATREGGAKAEPEPAPSSSTPAAPTDTPAPAAPAAPAAQDDTP
ncbi:polyisoprenoid-binding protein YceI [Xanthomonas sacchari]|uniref:YceI family protein n=1 Tax=unclassified Xanthomonas TaxID=2643310 RepID=UPI0013704D3C|nr:MULTISPECIES: YceI family protein [unclassified Xanthomonas]MBB6368016.1 polyisoprenoid-binding protein YceI [Xanthomonas sp. F10]MXV32575.1 polyisoprenoid-binding protein [Xanthomonas sp. LMG 8989]